MIYLNIIANKRFRRLNFRNFFLKTSLSNSPSRCDPFLNLKTEELVFSLAHEFREKKSDLGKNDQDGQ